jgi:hypothetical protein
MIHNNLCPSLFCVFQKYSPLLLTKSFFLFKKKFYLESKIVILCCNLCKCQRYIIVMFYMSKFVLFPNPHPEKRGLVTWDELNKKIILY